MFWMLAANCAIDFCIAVKDACNPEPPLPRPLRTSCHAIGAPTANGERRLLGEVAPQQLHLVPLCVLTSEVGRLRPRKTYLSERRQQLSTSSDARLSVSRREEESGGPFPPNLPLTLEPTWLERGFSVALFCLEKQCLGLFRGFFVVFSWPPFWAKFTRTRPGTVF